MNRLTLGIALLLGLVARADDWKTATVVVDNVVVTGLPDGGSSVQAWATLTKPDGKSMSDVSEAAELTGRAGTLTFVRSGRVVPFRLKTPPGGPSRPQVSQP